MSVGDHVDYVQCSKCGSVNSLFYRNECQSCSGKVGFIGHPIIPEPSGPSETVAHTSPHVEDKNSPCVDCGAVYPQFCDCGSDEPPVSKKVCDVCGDPDCKYFPADEESINNIVRLVRFPDSPWGPVLNRLIEEMEKHPVKKGY